MGHAAFGQGGPWGERGVPPNIEDILRSSTWAIFSAPCSAPPAAAARVAAVLRFGASRRPRPRPGGRTVNYSMEIGFDDSLKGLNTTITVPKTVYENGAAQRRTERIQVKIPPGVTNGSRVRLAGKESSPRGRAAGESLHHHEGPLAPVFRAQGGQPLSRASHHLGGGHARDPGGDSHLRGNHENDHSPGTQSGQTFRLSGLGVSRLKGGGRGDLYVSVNIRLPSGWTRRARTSSASSRTATRCARGKT